MVFCLLWVRPEGLWGDQGIMSRDPEEPWAKEVTTTEEVPLREPTGIWRIEDSTLVFTPIFGIGGWLTSFPIAEGSTSSRPSEITSYLWAEAVFLLLVPWPASVPSAFPSTSDFLTTFYLIFFSLPLPMGVATPIASITPFLIGMPEEKPTMKSNLDQALEKSLA